MICNDSNLIEYENLTTHYITRHLPRSRQPWACVYKDCHEARNSAKGMNRHLAYKHKDEKTKSHQCPGTHKGLEFNEIRKNYIGIHKRSKKYNDMKEWMAQQQYQSPLAGKESKELDRMFKQVVSDIVTSCHQFYATQSSSIDAVLKVHRQKLNSIAALRKANRNLVNRNKTM